jgi:ribonucleoside-triphosphate reductase
MNLLQQVVYKTRYAKWLESEKRRENWEETVDRYMSEVFVKGCEKYDYVFTAEEFDECRSAILNMDVMPSMRAMMTAGPALERDNIAAYNCAYMAIKSKRDFAEALYILMNGTGVGFSCERQYISQLPDVPKNLEHSGDTLVVQDSKLGWAKAYNKLINSLYEGDIPSVDYSKVRVAGSRLRTFGGRASGPEPLRKLVDFTVNTYQCARGRKLSSLEVHDLLCTIGEVVVVGGVRRSALISLSNLTDRRMREAKVGAWWEQNKQRALANNSVAYTEKPDSEVFLEEWLSLVKSKSGERGIFNRVAAQRQAARYGRRSPDLDYGCNPCSEIILRDKQFCNLTEVVVRERDSSEDIQRKIRVATVLGTIQCGFTDFGFISSEWKRNCEEERLLGVSLTGIYDNDITSGRDVKDVRTKEAGVVEVGRGALQETLRTFREVAYETNQEWSKKLGIKPSAAITCVKPSGTVSQLVDSASGIHPRYSRYYIRNVRMDKKDPVCEFLAKAGIPNEPDSNFSESQYVFSFPCAAPASAVCGNDISAVEHLNLWKVYQDDYCEHKPSVTISVKQDEWPTVGAFVYENFDAISGVSFLPHTEHSYKQAPYIAISEEQYKELVGKMPMELNWNSLVEDHDETIASQELACQGGSCEI